MLNVALFLRQAVKHESPCMDECIRRIWYIPNVKYHSALKKKEILQHVAL